MNNITKYAIENTRVTFVALVLIACAGISSYLNMPRNEDPGFTVRTALIMTYFPGASPERMEELITDKLEKIIQEMPEIDYLKSESKTGASLIYVNIKESYDTMRPIWDDLRRKVEDAKRELPDGVIGPVVNDEFGDVFGVIIGLTGEGYTYAELKDIADETRDEFLTLSEVAKVEIQGTQEERIFVEFDNARLSEIGLSPAQLKAILENRNIIIPGGEIFTDNEQISLEPSGNFESVDDLKRTVVHLPGKTGVVYLQDLVNISRGYIDPPKTKFRHKNRPGLSISINMREGGNILKLGRQVNEKMAVFKQKYPIGVDMDILYFQPDFVQKKINEFEGSIFQSMAIVAAVMLLTLGMRTGLVVTSLIPMAMIATVLIMSFFKIGLDQMSLASLIIALGMLVDNAIVMSESIMVQMGAGKPVKEAAIDSANELKISLLTSSLTTAAAFLPIYLAESATGEYTAPLFMVVTITLMSSWVLALTMTPLLCVLFLKFKKTQKEAFNSAFYKKYRAFLIALLKNPLRSIGIIILIFLISMQGFRLIPNIFFPPNDKPVMQVEMSLPIGAPLAASEQTVKDIEEFIVSELSVSDQRKEGVVDFSSYIGTGAPRYVLNYSPQQQSPEVAYMLLSVTSLPFTNTVLVPKLEEFIYSHFPDLTARVSPLQLGSPVEAPVEVRISGKEGDELFKIIDKLKAQMKGMNGLKNIKDDWGMLTKKLLVKVDQPKALRAGLSSRDVAISLQTILSGIDTTEFREGEDAIPVTLRSVAADRKDIGKLEGHQIYVQSTGKTVPLKQVADIEVDWQLSRILRRDRLKTVTVQADVAEGFNAQALTSQIEDWLDSESKQWPLGYRYQFGGEEESSGKANRSIGDKVPVSLLIIVLLLVWQFNSIRKPLIILTTIPLGLTGVVLGLLVTKSYFGFMTLLGVISLAGIVINNAIILLDRIQFEIAVNGLSAQKAIVESAQQRLRPIFLTTATTVGGLLPLWFSGGPMWQPMAIAIIFGLSFATVLTLGVVPVLYSIFFRVSFSGWSYEK